jgi:probable F420-dependent oxidoreductase
MVLMAAVAARTQHMKFGPSVMVLSTRNPAIAAKQIATIDFLSKGRMLPAFGLGLDDEREYEAAGVKKSERGGRVDEAVAVMRRLWSEDDVTHHGRYFNFTNVSIDPKPTQRELPIWFGGRTEPALRRIGRIGDGWLASAITPEEVRSGIAEIKQFAAESEREIDDDHYGVLVNTYVAASAEAAQELAQPSVLRRRRDVTPETYSALGSPGDCIRLLERYVEAGASKFVLRPACAPEEMFDQLDWIGKEIIGPLQAVLA